MTLRNSVRVCVCVHVYHSCKTWQLLSVLTHKHHLHSSIQTYTSTYGGMHNMSCHGRPSPEAFFTARSRVAPKKQQSIPRLEVCAANRFLCAPLVFSSSSLKQHSMAYPPFIRFIRVCYIVNPESNSL